MNCRLEEKLQLASAAYESGESCAQAVFAAYRDELRKKENTAWRMMEEFGCGIGRSDGVCGVIAAASAIIFCLHSEGGTNGYTERIQRIFQREYGGITCRKILKGKDVTPFCCQMKVKDMILVMEQILGSMDWSDAS